MFNRRIFMVSFDPEKLPRFKTNAEVMEFYAAIGRMFMYGLYNETNEDSVSLVTGHFDSGGKELVCCYCPSLPEYPVRWPDGSTKVLGSTADKINSLLHDLEALAAERGRPFVMAAVNHGDHWGFHS